MHSFHKLNERIRVRTQCHRPKPGGSQMYVLQSNRDALLLAIPMVGLMFAGFFRLDEILGRPKKAPEMRRQRSGLDATGRPICMDPDGRMPVRKSRAQ